MRVKVLIKCVSVSYTPSIIKAIIESIAKVDNVVLLTGQKDTYVVDVEIPDDSKSGAGSKQSLSENELISNVQLFLNGASVIGYKKDSQWHEISGNDNFSELTKQIDSPSATVSSTDQGAGSAVEYKNTSAVTSESKDNTPYDPVVNYKGMEFTCHRAQTTMGIDIDYVIKHLLAVIAKWPLDNIKAVKGKVISKHAFTIEVIGCCTESEKSHELIGLSFGNVMKQLGLTRDFVLAKTSYKDRDKGVGTLINVTSETLKKITNVGRSETTPVKTFLESADQDNNFRNFNIIICSKTQPKISTEDAKQKFLPVLCSWQLYDQFAHSISTTLANQTIDIVVRGICAHDAQTQKEIFDVVNRCLQAAGLAEEYQVVRIKYNENGLGVRLAINGISLRIVSLNRSVPETKNINPNIVRTEIDPEYEYLIIEFYRLVGSEYQKYWPIIQLVEKKEYSQAIRELYKKQEPKAFQLVRLFSLPLVINHTLSRVNAPDSSGKTLAHYAAAESSDEVYNYLIQMGCDPTKKDKQGLTPENIRETYHASKLSKEIAAKLQEIIGKGDDAKLYTLFMQSINDADYSMALCRACASKETKAFLLVKMLFSYEDKITLKIDESIAGEKSALDQAKEKSAEVYEFLLRKHEQRKSMTSVRSLASESKAETKGDEKAEVKTEVKVETPKQVVKNIDISLRLDLPPRHPTLSPVIKASGRVESISEKFVKEAGTFFQRKPSLTQTQYPRNVMSEINYVQVIFSNADIEMTEKEFTERISALLKKPEYSFFNLTDITIESTRIHELLKGIVTAPVLA